jgi:hypothetical protein
VSRRTLARVGGLAAILAGIFWGFTLPLIATQATDDPVGLRYDDFNRWLTLPLALLLVTLVVLGALLGRRLPAQGTLGTTLAALGAGLMLLGNLVEFWAVMLTDDYVAAIAEDRRVDEWVGSTIGWLGFLIGVFLLLVGGSLVALAAQRARALPAWVGVILTATAPALLAAAVLWASSVEATIVVAVALGLAWNALGLWMRARATGLAEAAFIATEPRV